MNRLIFGCGYLGKRIAKKWVAAGDRVYAVTRKAENVPQLESLGLTPLIGDVTNPESLANLPDAETVLVAVGMDRTQYSDIREVYVDGLRNVLSHLSDATSHLIYVSSTGVYGDFGGRWIDETAPTNPTRDGGRACLEAEEMIAASRFGSSSTVLRFAGIYGPGRVPTRALIESKQWNKLSAGFLNLIQADDGANVIQTVAAESPESQTFHVSDGNPPLRREYYQFIAEYLGVGEICWKESDRAPQNPRSASNKRVSNRKLLERYGIQFEFPDFKAGLTQALDVTTG